MGTLARDLGLLSLGVDRLDELEELANLEVSGAQTQSLLDEADAVTE